jgi:DNA-binding SARP family transcriptional activator
MGVRFSLFGNVAAYLSESPLDIGPARQQTVIAALLVDANHCVSTDELIGRVWDDQSLPARPRGALQTYLSLLRRALAGAEDVVIERRQAGYLLRVAEDAVDLLHGRALIRQALRAADDGYAGTLLESALVMWEGAAFGTLDTQWLNRVRVALEKERWQARLELADIQLRSGRHHELMAVLSEWAGENSLDERLAGQYMLALCRNGRQADALAHYLCVRERLADDLGVDPGPPLQRLYQQILAGDPALHQPAAATLSGGRNPVVARQLPAPPRAFVGRGQELAQVNDTLAAPGTSPASMTILSVSGVAGIGKTWFALHWAHHNLCRFPEGQLYVDLLGFCQFGAPLPADTALHTFLLALGLAPNGIPASLADKSALYRSLMAGKRMLVVLDNARDAEQVVPLLPGSTLCTVLITSRPQLTDLFVSHGAVHLGLDVLPETEARELLARHLGPDRVDAEPEAVATVLDRCAGLPLALGIVAVRAVTSPDLPLSAFADELEDSATRLDSLGQSYPRGDVRAALSWSRNALDEDAAAVFELLGLAQGPDISVSAVAALTAVPPALARITLRTLASVNLVHEHMPQRYRMHDLIRLYAADRAGRALACEARTEATRRLADFYLDAALSCDRLLDPHRPQIMSWQPAMARSQHPGQQASAALDWFAAEHANLLATQQLAAARDWQIMVWQLAWALTTFHRRRGLLHDHIGTWQAGLAAAQRLGDPAAHGLARRHLGHAYALAGRHAEAIDQLTITLELARHSGDTVGLAYTHRTLAAAWDAHGDRELALKHATSALELFAILADPVWHAFSLNQVGWCCAKLGHLSRARACCERALEIFRRYHDVVGQAITLDSLGYIASQEGDRCQAVGFWRQSVALLRDSGHSYYEAETLERLAVAHAVLGEQPEADDALRQAYELYRNQNRDRGPRFGSGPHLS